MRALSKAVVKNEADLGVLFDADCDRAAIVLSDGRFVNKNRLIALTAAMLLSQHAGADHRHRFGDQHGALRASSPNGAARTTASSAAIAR